MFRHILIPRHALLICTTALCLMGSFSAQAEDCLSRSPSWQGDKYEFTATQTRELTRAEYHSLSAMFKQIAARDKWQGEGKKFDCYGDENNPRRVSKSYRITATVDLDSSNNLAITLQFSSRKDGTSFQRHLRLYLSPSHFRAGSSGPEGDVEPIIIDNNEVTYLVKSRNSVGATKTRTANIAREEIRAITLAGGTLRIEMVGYTQGFLSYGYSWTLH